MGPGLRRDDEGAASLRLALVCSSGFVLEKTSGRTQREIAEDLGIGLSTLRRWVDKHYADRLADCPLRHLIMLAPANHGSSLAILGKARVGRLQAWISGVEPGQ